MVYITNINSLIIDKKYTKKIIINIMFVLKSYEDKNSLYGKDLHA
jgi:hypothetical protein